MKNWMGKLSFLAFCCELFTLSPSGVSAQEQPEEYIAPYSYDYNQSYYNSSYPYYGYYRRPSYSYCNQCCFGCFEVGADFIYWKPCIDDLEFAACVDTTTGSGTTEHDVKIKELCPDWEPGVRVYLYKPDFFCNLGLRLSYTYFNICDSSSTGTGDYHSPLFHPQLVSGGSMTDLTVKGSYDVCYHEWDVLFCFDCECCECALIRPYGGVAGIVFDQELEVEETFTMSTNEGVANVKWTSDYWGVGLRAGVHYEFRLSPCLNIFGWGHGTLLAGERDNKNDQDCVVDSKTDILKIDEDTKCHCIPGYHIGAGFRYDACLCGCEYFFRLGYEFLVWYNLPNQRSYSGDNFTTEVAHGSSASVRTAMLHGLFVGAGISF